MKLYIISDLHLEFGAFVPPQVDADVVILAGDIHLGVRGVEWAVQHFPDKPVLYVAGNHEYYGHALPRLLDKLYQKAQGTSVHILENTVVKLGSVTFFGCTLWTDFQLFGHRREAMRAAAERMTDFRRIRVSPQYRRLRPDDTMRHHFTSRHWLAHSFAGITGKRVVITHHAPSALSLAENRKTNLISAAYASHCEELVEASQAALWVHGHTHHAVDYTIKTTRVLSNPRGYADEPVAGFEPHLVVTV